MDAIIAGIDRKNKKIVIMNATKSSIQNRIIRIVTISIGKNFKILRIVWFVFMTCPFAINTSTHYKIFHLFSSSCKKEKSGKWKVSLVAFGRDEATRTPDPYVPNVVRYQLRYIPKTSVWQGRGNILCKRWFSKSTAKVHRIFQLRATFPKFFVLEA